MTQNYLVYLIMLTFVAGQKSVRVMVFNTTFNNISVISWWSLLLMEKTGKSHWSAASPWQMLSHNVVSSTTRPSEFELSTLVVIGTERPYDHYHNDPLKIYNGLRSIEEVKLPADKWMNIYIQCINCIW